MEFKTIMENWRRNVLNELHRTGMTTIAKRDGGDPNQYWPTPRSKYPQRGYLAHNWRTKFEIEDGTIQLKDITDEGAMIWSIVPFDNARKTKYGSYDMVIQFANWEQIVTAQAPTKEKVLALLKNAQGNTDDLKIHCTCPSFKYHYNYVADKVHGSAINPESRPASIMNPGNEGIGCKHIRRMIERVPNWYTDVYYKVKDIEERLKAAKEPEPGEDEGI